MEPNVGTGAVSKGQRLTGRILRGLAAAFLLFDSTLKFLKPAVVVDTTTRLGYSASVITPLGVLLLVCTLLFLIPRTSVLGAILLTGYLGGAVATHTRVGDPLFSHILFPVYLGIMIWVGLCLRYTPLREFFPLTR